MSHIPNSAMPHAGTTSESQPQESGRSFTSAMRERAGSVMESARAHPKTTAAAGAAMVAGVAAAAAVPFMLRRNGEQGGGSRKS